MILFNIVHKIILFIKYFFDKFYYIRINFASNASETFTVRTHRIRQYLVDACRTVQMATSGLSNRCIYFEIIGKFSYH